MPTTEPANPALGRAIRALRKDRGLTIEDLAHDAGITFPSLSRIEKSEANPAWTTVERLAEALGVSLVELSAAIERAES